MKSDLVERCRNKWPFILMALGVGLTQKALNGRDGPCPKCGGKDRFRFSDKDGGGTWYCHQCREGGGGIGLVMHVRGVDFKEAARLIETVIAGGNSYSGGAGGGNGYSSGGAGGGNDKPKDPLKSWRLAYPDVRGTAVDIYLKGRGLELTEVERAALRFHPALFHHPTQNKWPAMVAAVGPFGGPAVTCHQTFLDIDGSGKAPVDKPKLFPAGASTIGLGVWFGEADPEREFIVAEGIESLLSALRLCGVGAGCAALSASGIRTLILPPQARKALVFADSDEMQQGLAAANEARRRWLAEGRTVRVVQASREGEDANDVWVRRMKLSGDRPA
jgi:putative DNA primase/helicase